MAGIKERTDMKNQIIANKDRELIHALIGNYFVVKKHGGINIWRQTQADGNWIGSWFKDIQDL